MLAEALATLEALQSAWTARAENGERKGKAMLARIRAEIMSRLPL
jgi:hypothetical protein